MKIYTYPHKILRQKAKEIENISPEIQELTEEMAETMKKNNGIGLAAPQIGKSIRLITVETKDGPLVLINPKILWKSKESEIMEEGCLSLPNIYRKIERAYKIKVLFLDKTGKKRKLKPEGLLARVIQHEVDHLEGILIIDY